MCESLSYSVDGCAGLFVLPVARCLPYDDVQGIHVVYRNPLSFPCAAASVALRILFALPVECCNL